MCKNFVCSHWLTSVPIDAMWGIISNAFQLTEEIKIESKRSDWSIIILCFNLCSICFSVCFEGFSKASQWLCDITKIFLAGS